MPRLCTECSAALQADASPRRVTCSDTCRRARSRRLLRRLRPLTLHRQGRLRPLSRVLVGYAAETATRRDVEDAVRHLVPEDVSDLLLADAVLCHRLVEVIEAGGAPEVML